MSLHARARWLGAALMAIASPLLATALQEEAAAVEPSALGPLPSDRQRAWRELELYGAIYFGPETFGGEAFEPTDLDCRQWAAVARSAGLRGLILDVRPSGFALWPSTADTVGVRTSSWRDGRGDVLRELSEACREAELRLGIELAAGPSFEADLAELCGAYGAFFEIRVEGAVEGSTALETIRRLQPDAVVAGGPDVRRIDLGAADASDDAFSTALPQASGNGDERSKPTWIGTEASGSMRPGRYWRPSQDESVKTPYELEALWLEAVGRDAALCLELAPDRRGQIPAADAASLTTWATLLRLTHATDIARGTRTLSDAVRGAHDAFAPRRVVDGDPTTYWATDDEVHTAQLEIDLGLPATFNRIFLGEYVPLGERVTTFSIEAFEQGEWHRLVAGNSIGRKRVVAIPAVSSRRLLLNLAARGPITLATFGLHLAPPRVSIEPAGGGFIGTRAVELASDVPDATIHFTLDGSEPSADSPVYGEPLQLDATTVVRARAFFEDLSTVEPATASFRAWTADELLHPLHLLRAPEPGLRWRSCEGNWSDLTAVDWTEPVAEGTAPTVDAELRTRVERVALLFEGYVQAPVDGVYAFHASCDFVCRTQIGDRTILDLAGGAVERSAEIGLRRGWHPLRIEALNPGPDATLDVRWSGPAFERVALDGEALGH